jgi:hypothetical protein
LIPRRCFHGRANANAMVRTDLHLFSTPRFGFRAIRPDKPLCCAPASERYCAHWE